MNELERFLDAMQNPGPPDDGVRYFNTLAELDAAVLAAQLTADCRNGDSVQHHPCWWVVELDIPNDTAILVCTACGRPAKVDPVHLDSPGMSGFLEHFVAEERTSWIDPLNCTLLPRA
jgi:hypothetical protein